MAQPATQAQRLDFLLRYLLGERKEYRNIEIPAAQPEKQRLLRSLMNVRPPAPASEAFLRVQDAYLQEETKRRGTTDVAGLQPVQSGIYLWQGDITTLRCDAIVNAANSQMLGCFVPCHGCIDNAIHTWAGVQLRLACAQQMQRQGREEAPGRAKITPGFNLPCRYVLHTVGPMVGGAVTRKDRELLAGCYRSCLNLAAAHGLHSVAFCCISTGEFHFPAGPAAEIAVQTVREWRRQNPGNVEVIFNVFQDSDYAIYKRLLDLGHAAETGAARGGRRGAWGRGRAFHLGRVLLYRRTLSEIFWGFYGKIRLSRYVFRRVLPVSHAGRALGVLEPVYLHQPVYGCSEACL